MDKDVVPLLLEKSAAAVAALPWNIARKSVIKRAGETEVSLIEVRCIRMVRRR
jgi:hypothetical protein